MRVDRFAGGDGTQFLLQSVVRDQVLGDGPVKAFVGNGIGRPGDRELLAHKCSRLGRDPPNQNPVDTQRAASSSVITCSAGNHITAGDPEIATHRRWPRLRTATHRPRRV